MERTKPESYPRRILLAVTGLSPQVVTESIHALATGRAAPFVPTEVHLITTGKGRERAELALLSDDPGWFHRLCRDYGLPEIRFTPDHIHAVPAAEDQALDDIRSPEHNERLADFITEKVREFTADPASTLHASIAGGRKTMGFYLGYALSLYGRPQDRLSHVLVSEPFESSWDFFYPTPYSRVITDRDNNLIDTKNAEVVLAEIPFVSLRHGLPDSLLEGQATFSGTVAAAQRALGPAELEIDLWGRGVVAGGEAVRLSPAELAFYAWHARRAQAGEAPLACPKEGVYEPEYAVEYLRYYRRIIGPLGDDDRVAAALARGMDKNYFERRKAGVNKKLKARLGAGAAPYLIRRFGKRPHWRHGLGLVPERITIEGAGRI